MNAFFAAFLSLFFVQAASAYTIDHSKISVSGISSGAYMAGQMHVAHSATFMGIGIIAGGPYFCTFGDLVTALNTCMDTFLGAPNLPKIISVTNDFANQGIIDSLDHLAASKVFILTGKADRTVTRPVVDKAVEFYQKMGVSSDHLKFVTQLNMGHAFPTDNFGNPCSTVSSEPWISNCGYDGAGEVLKQMYGPLNAKTKSVDKNFLLFSQERYADTRNVSMAQKAVAYVPANCQNDATCSLHVVFHGCRQTMEDMQDEFFKNAGYAEWAEANNMIILFPQAAIDSFKNNPKGCWDWWGYNGDRFATKEGAQIKAVYKMVQDFTNPAFKLVVRKRKQ